MIKHKLAVYVYELSVYRDSRTIGLLVLRKEQMQVPWHATGTGAKTQASVNHGMYGVKRMARGVRQPNADKRVVQI